MSVCPFSITNLSDIVFDQAFPSDLLHNPSVKITDKKKWKQKGTFEIAINPNVQFLTLNASKKYATSDLICIKF